MVKAMGAESPGGAGQKLADLLVSMVAAVVLNVDQLQVAPGPNPSSSRNPNLNPNPSPNATPALNSNTNPNPSPRTQTPTLPLIELQLRLAPCRFTAHLSSHEHFAARLVSPLYLSLCRPCISPISPLHLPYISLPR